jgi:hypothetical protein
MMACISANVLALVEFVVMLHVLLHRLANGMILVVVHDVCICHILCVYAATTLYQWKLLCVEIFVGVRGEATTHRLLLVLLVVAAGSQVR